MGSVEGTKFELANILGVLATYILQNHTYDIDYEIAFNMALKLVMSNKIPIKITLTRDDGTLLNVSDLRFNFI